MRYVGQPAAEEPTGDITRNNSSCRGVKYSKSARRSRLVGALASESCPGGHSPARRLFVFKTVVSER